MENIIAAAATIVGETENEHEFNQKMFETINKLQKMVKGFTEHNQRIQECLQASEDGTKRAFQATLVAVKKINKGSNVIKGYLQFEPHENATNLDDEGYEYIETAPLYTPEGKFEYYQATLLVGKKVNVYKKFIALPQGKKARECAAIEPS